jgi:antitoxin component YwqK of YwqJK toxin-antitoxin module
MKKILFVFSLAFLFAACGVENNQDVSDKKKGSEDTLRFDPAEGLPDGPSTTYHPNGGIKTKGTIVDGKRHGLWESFYENGTKWSETNYAYGVREGKTVSYHKNGFIHYIGYYSSNKKTGKWMIYDEAGVLIQEDNYVEEAE